MRTLHRKSLVVVLLLLAACAKAPESLSPVGVQDYRANEAVVAIGTVQSAAINLNKVQVCDKAGACRDLLSDENTRIVVDAVSAALNTIKATPDGWKATTNAALDQVNLQLDAHGKSKLKAYIDAARLVINAIGA